MRLWLCAVDVIEHCGPSLDQGNTTVHGPGAGLGETLQPHSRSMVPWRYPIRALRRTSAVLHKLYLLSDLADCSRSCKVPGKHEYLVQGVLEGASQQNA
jgi:hypothetical protein